MRWLDGITDSMDGQALPQVGPTLLKLASLGSSHPSVQRRVSTEAGTTQWALDTQQGRAYTSQVP